MVETVIQHAWTRGRLDLFLILTFTLSWSFELGVALTIGHPAFLNLGLAPWSMFVPASVGLALQLFTFRDSPMHVRRDPERSILIPVSFLVLTVLYGIVTLLAIGLPSQSNLFGSVGNLLTTLWTLALFSLFGQVGEEGFRRVGLSLGGQGWGFRILLDWGSIGLLCLALVVLLVLHDRVWQTPANESLLEPQKENL